MVIKVPVRVLIGIMIFLGYFLIYIVRYNISVHIVDMSQILEKTRKMKLMNSTKLLIKSRSSNKLENYLKLKDVYWSEMKIAKLFSAYYVGYCVCFPIFHNWGDRLGPTWVVGIAGFTSGLVTCLSPAAAFYSNWAYFFIRIVKGFCAGAMQPSMVQLLRNWVPPIERNYFMWAYCGITIGTFSTFLICALIHYYSRWPLGFYLFGGCQILWACTWVFVVSDKPQSHPCLSKKELTYLENTIKTMFNIKLTNSHAPWRVILRSMPFWAICVQNFGYAWMIIALCIHGPLYYSVVTDYSIYEASALTACPFLFRLLLGTAAIHATHWFKHKEDAAKFKTIKKYTIMFSHVIPGLLIASLWLTSIVPGPILLTFAVALTAVGMEQTLELCHELSPTFANSIHTVIKILGNLPGIIISYSVGLITEKYGNTAFVWKHIWCFHGCILLCSGLFFLIFGNTEEQKWTEKRVRPLRKIKTNASKLSQIVELEEMDSINILTKPNSISFQIRNSLR